MEDERYQADVFNKSFALLNEYDNKMIKSKKYSLCEEANEKIVEMLKKCSKDMLSKVLANASEGMKTRYHRGDN